MMGVGDESREYLNVLLVDDDPRLRELLHAMLAGREGFNVHSVGGGAEALAELARRDYDVLIMDYHLGDMEGDELLMKVSLDERTRSIPVILVSGDPTAEFRLIDVFDYLVKPVDFSRLFEDLEYIRGLKRYAREEAGDSPGRFRMSLELFERLCDVLRRKCGLDLPARRKAEVERAVAKRCKAVLKPSVESYVEMIEREAEGREVNKLVLMLTVGETYFFRNTLHFEAVSRYVFPRIREAKQRKGDYTVRIWSAGCSTGEEAYSLAIAARDFFRESFWNVRVIGTDINNRALVIAREGCYRRNSFRVTDEAFARRYFERKGEFLCIDPSLKSFVEFHHLNLKRLSDAGELVRFRNLHGPFDLIFCRNVLIYFDEETIRRCIEAFSRLLEPEGYLFLGHSEGAMPGNLYFDTIYKFDAFFYRRRADAAARRAAAELHPEGGPPEAAGMLSCAIEEDSGEGGGSGALFELPSSIGAPFEEYLRGVEMLERDERAEAEGVFESMRHRFPDSPWWRVGKSLLAADQGRQEEAESMVGEALMVDPSTPDAYFVRALLHERAGRLEEACADYRKALLWDEEFMASRVNLGFLLGRLGRKSESADTFAEALGILEELASLEDTTTWRCRRARRLVGGMSFESLSALVKGKAGGADER